MGGVTFMVDSKGKKTAAVIDLRRHRKLWEDFYDIALTQSRAGEPRESLASVKRRLSLARRMADYSATFARSARNIAVSVVRDRSDAYR